jgi:hypothetical protein
VTARIDYKREIFSRGKKAGAALAAQDLKTKELTDALQSGPAAATARPEHETDARVGTCHENELDRRSRTEEQAVESKQGRGGQRIRHGRRKQKRILSGNMNITKKSKYHLLKYKYGSHLKHRGHYPPSLI